jgi:hypothetical protein
MTAARTLLACLVAGAMLWAHPAEARPARLKDLSTAALDARAQHDLERFKSYNHAVYRLRRAIHREFNLLDRRRDEPLSPDERKRVLALFEQVVQYVVALDGLARFHADFWRIPVTRDPERHARHFAVGFAASALRMTLGLEFVGRTLNKPQFEKLLDEGAPDLGLPPRAYALLKYNVVHVKDASVVVAARQYHRLMEKTAYKRIDDDPLFSFALASIEAHYPQVWSDLVFKGAHLFAGNGFDILKDAGYGGVWLPVQTDVAEYMGDTKVKRAHEFLISRAQIGEAVKKSRPGDVLVERRNWYLSNIGLPGFWPHAALYVGTPEELATYLDDDEEVRAAYLGPFSAHLKKRYPSAWAAWTSSDEQNHLPRVLEAVSEGVIFTTAEHSFDADYVGALRPRTSKLEVARAIERAFGYLWRPYDFDFDFFTDTSLVCSELVYKAYEPRAGVRGIRLPLESVVGRMTLGPNTIVRLFDEKAGTADAPFDFVFFLDGREKSKNAVWGDESSFRRSWSRPKWDTAQK